MATQLGGIYEGGEGIGAGLAQVFPKQQYEVPDVAGAYQKGMALAAKKKEAEDKAKQEKAIGVEGWTGDPVTGSAIGIPMINGIREKISKGEMPTAGELE